MLGLGWTELMVIGVVGLIVIGPKDLPDMFRTLGRFTAKAKRMAGEFQRAMESAADDTGLKDVAKDMKSMTSARSMGLDAVKGAVTKFEAWDPMKPQAKAMAPPAPVAAVNGSAVNGPVANGLATNGRGLNGLATPAPVASSLQSPPSPAYGPATQALADTQAARRTILADATAALKAVDAGAGAPSDAPALAKPPGRRRAVAKPLETPELLHKKPRASRKTVVKADAP